MGFVTASGRICVSGSSAIDSDLDEVHTAVASGAGADLVALAVAIIIGVAFDSLERFGTRAHDDTGMGPIAGCVSNQEEAARSGLVAAYKLPFVLRGSASESQENEGAIGNASPRVSHARFRQQAKPAHQGHAHVFLSLNDLN